MKRADAPKTAVEMTLTTRETCVSGSDFVPLLAQVSEDARPPAAANSTPAASRHLVVFTLVASLGGLLFGYDTGVISGALPYLRDSLLQHYADDAARLAWVQEVIVSAAIIAAGVGSAAGGFLSDRLGRKRALLAADVLFTAGALAMAAAQAVGALVVGRALVGLGVGLASVTVPVYIAEAAPPALRGNLVTINVFFITGGQFLAYLLNYLFSFAPSGQWRWMLGAAALPSLAQMAGLLLLPESPGWLAAKGRVVEAQAALALLQPGRLALQQRRQREQQQQREEGEEQVSSSDFTRQGPAAEAAAQQAEVHAGSPTASLDVESSALLQPADGPKPGRGVWRQLRSGVVLRELHVGLGLQVLQQVAGINTVMYYTPAILELAGFHNKQTALLLALIPAGTNALGTLVGAACIDRFGRRPLLLASVAGVAAALAALGGVFRAAEQHSPTVLAQGSTCTAAVAAAGMIADCTACLHAGCGFCGAAAGDLLTPGTCLTLDAHTAAACADSASGSGSSVLRMLYVHGCPSAYTWWILGGLLLYLAAFAPGLGPVPWAVNSELYPLEVRGLATGLAATANWLANAAVAQTFLTLTQALGGSGAFWLYALFALAGLAWVAAVLPETNGLPLEEVQLLFSQQQQYHHQQQQQQQRQQRQPWGLSILRGWRHLQRRSSGGGEAEAAAEEEVVLPRQHSQRQRKSGAAGSAGSHS